MLHLAVLRTAAADIRRMRAIATPRLSARRLPIALPMPLPRLDPKLVYAWQAAHCLARAAPAPVADRGGVRVDTGSEKETRRWLFAQPCDGLGEIAREIVAPRHYLKLSGDDDELRSALPARWQIQPINFFMSAAAVAPSRPLPDGYALEVEQAGAVTKAHILAACGELAASGCAAETADVFVYDRIETAPEHRRKGLGAAVMGALAAARKSAAAEQWLVATADGRALYANLGWAVRGPLAAAVVAEA